MAHLRWLLCVATLLSCAHGSRKLGRRELTSEESTRCAVQLEEVRELKIPIAIARTVKGFSLAVYDVKKGVEDTTSAELLTKGMWDGSMSTRALEFAASSLGRAPASWKKCAQPPCYQHAAIDVGASVGWWSFNSASRGWKTVAIEASPMNVALLRVSMCLNPELAPFINLQHKLVGTHEGSCALAVTAQNIGNGYIHCELEGQSVEWSADELRQLKTQDSTLPVARAFKVPVSRLGDVLDDVWEQDPKAPYVVSFMKLDLEGSEYAALNGTLLWLKKGRLPVIHSELWRSIHGGVEGYVRLLQKFGYSVKTGSCLNPNPIEQGIGVTFFRQAMRRITDICAILPVPTDN